MVKGSRAFTTPGIWAFIVQVLIPLVSSSCLMIHNNSLVAETRQAVQQVHVDGLHDLAASQGYPETPITLN